ncbi:hypothetical protein BU24DRAFT_427445 [Aaosphaeria arxii CBS 175.79]|uniref:Uncharacterized protein n=1 Tax=Aaosphaeria arxii CBS 175.79 TaxID=1450172 RepID=A0A6A5XBM6_9PLEO|nr:uncharacterized protein BU24DRAFT_427445 [Aaosphaeria arxii CBS 175.79]KAF2010320.1 hypothetical protein BU24DRAFT_427445 [Aaosphaeria arxii CBS 175.79]
MLFPLRLFQSIVPLLTYFLLLEHAPFVCFLGKIRNSLWSSHGSHKTVCRRYRKACREIYASQSNHRMTRPALRTVSHKLTCR